MKIGCSWGRMFIQLDRFDSDYEIYPFDEEDELVEIPFDGVDVS